MKKQSRRHMKRIRKMFVVCALCAIILTVSTYAWFIGMKTVNLSSFDVTIAAIDSLSLSLDGKTWSDSISISEGTYKTSSYNNNTNSWGNAGGVGGLIPISTVGRIDTNSSRMIMFEKGSFTQTPGGYRIMASRVTNSGEQEAKGYVVFDLFIKNLSGNEYYSELNQLNEEAIYLTTDSAVTVAEVGGVEGTGIENSVRVAFAQIGRVKATTTDDLAITGITCSTAGIVTGICADRDAQIWEPNDTKHVQNAINWYNESCLTRTGADLTLDTSYSGVCKTVAEGVANKTYAVSGVINYTDRVDTYDGTDYNGYTGSIADEATEGKLVAYDYFTDTMKMKESTQRPPFVSLAPNSITKVRIYVYIEGQDVDNYDFSALGKKISVQFGFTKERYFGEDVDYDDTGTAPLPDDVIRPKTEEPTEP